MKFIRIIIPILILVWTGSCGNDEEDLITPLLIGSWQTTKVVISGCDDINDNRPNNIYVPCPNSECLELEFYVDGTMFFKSHPSTSSYIEYDGTFSVSGKILTYCLENVSPCFEKVVEDVNDTNLYLSFTCFYRISDRAFFKSFL